MNVSKENTHLREIPKILIKTKFRPIALVWRVSDLLCMSNLAHASKLKEHDDNDDIQGSIRRAAERR